MDADESSAAWHNANYGIQLNLLRTVGLVLQFLARSSEASDHEMQPFFTTHALALYMPLKTLRPRLRGLPISDPGDPFDEGLWRAFYEHVQYGAPAPEIRYPGLTTCPVCKVQIDSALHFNGIQHNRNALLQRFRFAPVGIQLEEHQNWMVASRLQHERRYHGVKGRVDIWFERKDGDGTRAFVESEWRLGPRNVTVISGSSHAGFPVCLRFRVLNRSNIAPSVYAPYISDVPNDLHWYVAVERVPPNGGQAEIFVTIPGNLYLGFRYFELQFWVTYYTTENVRKFLPFCAIVQWQYYNAVICHQAREALSTAVAKTKRALDCKGVARKPNSTHNPPKDGNDNGTPINRALKPTPLSDPALAPFYDVWAKATGRIATRSNRLLAHSTAERELIALDDYQRAEELLDLQQPIDFSRFAPRLLAELVGQLEYEEDDPSNAALTGIRDPVAEDFLAPTMRHTTMGPSVLSEDQNCFYLTVLVETCRYRPLNITKLARLIHRQWPFKFMTEVVGVGGFDAKYSRLILMLNNGARRMFRDPTTVVEGLMICRPLGPAATFMISLLKTLIFEEPVIPSGQPPASIEKPSDSGVWDVEATVTPTPTTSNENPDDPEGGENSRKQKFKEHFRCGFDGFFRHLFHQTTAPMISPNWDHASEHVDSLTSLNEEQQDIGQSLFRGQRIILCKAPPGTGKTTCIATLVAALSMDHPAKRFLCLTATNTAGNVLTDRLVKAYRNISGDAEPPRAILRYLRRNYDTSRLTEDVLSVSATRSSDDEEIQTTNSTSDIMNYKIVVCTFDLAVMDIVNSLDVFSRQNGSEVIGKSHFDVVIIDEAASVDLPRTAIALSLVGSGQAVLLGDVYQLPAYITNTVLKRYGAEESQQLSFSVAPVFSIRIYDYNIDCDYSCCFRAE